MFDINFVILSGETEIITGINDDDKRLTTGQTAFWDYWQ